MSRSGMGESDDDDAQSQGNQQAQLLAGGIAAAGMLGLAPSFVMTARRAAAAGLDDVHVTAAQKAKELAGGRTVTLTIMQPSGSLGNVKPVADRFTEETGIEFDYLEVPLGEINQKVLLEAVSRSGSFDIALPATFGIPDLAESGILVNLDQYRREIRAGRASRTMPCSRSATTTRAACSATRPTAIPI